jgi:hypothetical protein
LYDDVHVTFWEITNVIDAFMGHMATGEVTERTENVVTATNIQENSIFVWPQTIDLIGQDNVY